MTSAGETAAFAAAARRALQAGSGSLDLAAIGKNYIEATAFRSLRAPVLSTKRWTIIFIAASSTLPCRKPGSFSSAGIPWIHAGRFTKLTSRVSSRSHTIRSSWRTTTWPFADSQHTGSRCCHRMFCSKSITRTSLRIKREKADHRFSGLPWDDEVLRFHPEGQHRQPLPCLQVRRPVYASSVGKWRHHAERLAPLSARLATELSEAELA